MQVNNVKTPNNAFEIFLLCLEKQKGRHWLTRVLSKQFDDLT